MSEVAEAPAQTLEPSKYTLATLQIQARKIVADYDLDVLKEFLPYANVHGLPLPSESLGSQVASILYLDKVTELARDLSLQKAGIPLATVEETAEKMKQAKEPRIMGRDKKPTTPAEAMSDTATDDAGLLQIESATNMLTNLPGDIDAVDEWAGGPLDDVDELTDETHPTAPAQTLAEWVAATLNVAYPDELPAFKKKAFWKATGFNAVGDAEKEFGASEVKSLVERFISDEKIRKERPVPETIEPSSPPVIDQAIIPYALPTGLVSTPEFKVPIVLKIMASPEGQHLDWLCDMIVQGGLYPNINNKAKAITIACKGMELGIELYAAFEGIFIVFGQPFMSYKLLLALANRSGLVQDIDVQATDTQCIVKIQRKDRSIVHVETYTVEDARKAGYFDRKDKSGNSVSLWPKIPKTMCKARCISNACKTFLPEVLFGFQGVIAAEKPEQFAEIAQELHQDGGAEE